jgi:hypothetical protein
MLGLRQGFQRLIHQSPSQLDGGTGLHEAAKASSLAMRLAWLLTRFVPLDESCFIPPLRQCAVKSPTFSWSGVITHNSNTMADPTIPTAVAVIPTANPTTILQPGRACLNPTSPTCFFRNYYEQKITTPRYTMAYWSQGNSPAILP